MSTYGFAKYSLEYLGFTSAGFFAGADEIRALGCERWQGEAAEQLNFGFGAQYVLRTERWIQRGCAKALARRAVSAQSINRVIEILDLLRQFAAVIADLDEIERGYLD